MQVKIGEYILPIRHFTEKEFQKCVPACSYEQMQPLFLHQLDEVRQFCGIKFILSSAFRSSDYDKSKGRTGAGFHTKGRAIDILCRDSASRFKIVAACRKFGLSCGVASTFIHIDNRCKDDGYPDPILFLY